MDKSSSTGQASEVHFPPIHVVVPLLIVLVYGALLVTGFEWFGWFGHDLGVQQALPVYISLSILLLALQAHVSQNRSLGRILYLFGTSGFALVYAGAVVFFFAQTSNFIHSPMLYLVLNLFLVAVFLYDAVARRIREARHPYLDRWAGDPYGEWAADFAGLAVLCGLAALLLDLLGPHRFWGRFFPQLPQVIHSDGGEVVLAALPGAFHDLESADVTLALGAAGIALFFVVIVGILSAIPGLAPPPARQRRTKAGHAVQQFLAQLGEIADPALDRVLLSLRLVLGPLVWFIPAFSLAWFSVAVATYLSASFHDSSAGIVGLFFPVSRTALDSIGPGFLIVLLGLVALGAVVIAVSVVEHKRAVIADTLRVLGIAGRGTALVLAIALYSLALINAFAVLASNGAMTATPFQIGALGLGALALGIVFTLYPLAFERITGRARARRERVTVP